MKRPDWLETCFSSVIEQSDFRIDAIAFSSSSERTISDGSLRHSSGRFFSIVGARRINIDGQLIEQPLIDQNGIGTLGYLMRGIWGDPEVLAYAKIKPGNVGAVQLAPTCQATAGSIAQVHGGNMPPYYNYLRRGKYSKYR